MDKFINEISEEIIKLVKEKMEKFMDTERDVYADEHQVKKNGYYERKLLTRWGLIEDLRVPRTRDGEFYPSLLIPYHRTWHLEDIILTLYSGGMSLEEIEKVLRILLGATLSPAAISRITHVIYEDVQAWRNRPLKSKYVAIWLDATYMNLRRDTVKKEAFYVALGLDESGRKEILGFWIHPSESAFLWEEILHELKERGVQEVGIFITDGLRGIKDAIMRVFPNSKWQPCWNHISRGLQAKVRKEDISALMWDLKKVYKAGSKEEALKALEEVLNKWGRKYRSVRNSLMALYDDLLNFYDFPKELWRSIYTTNPIEKVIQELKRRFRPAILLPNQEAAEKLAYLVCVKLNESFQKRRLRVWLH